MQAEKCKFLVSVPTMEETSRNLFEVLSHPAGTCARCAACLSQMAFLKEISEFAKSFVQCGDKYVMSALGSNTRAISGSQGQP